MTIEFELDSPNGPHVTFSKDAFPEDVEAEIPEGWSVDWSNQIQTDLDQFAAPLVRKEDTDNAK